MVTFEIESDRYVQVGHGYSKPYFAVIYGGILDVEIEGDPSGLSRKDGHPILVGDAQPSYRMRFNRAPNIVLDEILLLQQHAESIPGLEVGQFVTIVDDSAYLLNEDGTRGDPVPDGTYLPI